VEKSYRNDPPLRAQFRDLVIWWIGDQVSQLVKALRRKHVLEFSMVCAEFFGGIIGICGEYSRSLRRIVLMACGLPVIATAVPGIAEIMGDKLPLPGIVVPIADVPALAGALENLLGDRAISRELGLRAKRRAQDFSLVSVGTQMRNFLLARYHSFHSKRCGRR